MTSLIEQVDYEFVPNAQIWPRSVRCSPWLSLSLRKLIFAFAHA